MGNSSLKLRVNAKFFPKAGNPNKQKEQDFSSTDMGSDRFIFSGIKHSGSLMLLGEDGSFSTKHAADPRYTSVARLLFDAWMGDRGEAFLKFIKKNRLSLGFELVCPRFLGDHIEVPKCAYLAVTCVTDLETGFYYSLPELVSFCREHSLPHGEYYFFKTSQDIPDLKTFGEKMHEKGELKDTLRLKERLEDLIKESKGMLIPGNIPHEEVQGEFAEGVMSSLFESKPGYDPIQHLNLSLGTAEVVKTKEKEALERLREMTKELMTLYVENKYSDEYPGNGHPKPEFWKEIKKHLEKKEVDQRIPDKTGRELIDKKESSSEIEFNGGKYCLPSKEAFLELLKALKEEKDTVAEHLYGELLKLSENGGFSPDKKSISIKVYQTDEGHRIHLKIKDDRMLLNKNVKGIGRGHVITLSMSLPPSEERSKNVLNQLENSKKVSQIGSVLKLKLPNYLFRRGLREAWYEMEKFFRKEAEKKQEMCRERAFKVFLKVIKDVLKSLIFEKGQKELETEMDRLFSPERIKEAEKLFNYAIAKRFGQANQEVKGENKEIEITSYFLKLLEGLKKGTCPITTNEISTSSLIFSEKKIKDHLAVILVHCGENNSDPKNKNQSYDHIPVLGYLYNVTNIVHKGEEVDNKDLKEDGCYQSFIRKGSIPILKGSGIEDTKKEINKYKDEGFKILLVITDINYDICTGKKIKGRVTQEEILKALGQEDNGDQFMFCSKRTKISKVEPQLFQLPNSSEAGVSTRLFTVPSCEERIQTECRAAGTRSFARGLGLT